MALGKDWTVFLKNDQGKEIHSREGINQIATNFYEKLYTKQDELVNFQYPTNVITNVEPTFLTDEVGAIVRQLKNNKAMGTDLICNEQIKNGGEVLIKNLTILFNAILLHKEIPTDWKKSNIILLFKKGDRHNIENYRPISLSPTLAKIFSKLIESLSRNILNSEQPVEQAGFRRGFSTIDHLFVINLLMQCKS